MRVIGTMDSRLWGCLSNASGLFYIPPLVRFTPVPPSSVLVRSFIDKLYADLLVQLSCTASTIATFDAAVAPAETSLQNNGSGCSHCPHYNLSLELNMAAHLGSTSTVRFFDAAAMRPPLDHLNRSCCYGARRPTSSCVPPLRQPAAPLPLVSTATVAVARVFGALVLLCVALQAKYFTTIGVYEYETCYCSTPPAYCCTRLCPPPRNWAVYT